MKVRVLVVVALSVMSCGGDDPAATAPPPRVPVELVPSSLGGAAVSVTEDDQARTAFGEIGDNALVADGRLWQFREGDQLVGTLQISTVKTKVDLTDPDQRRQIVNNILAGTRLEIDVHGVPVTMSDSDDKSVYLWFGRRLFQVLQLKGSSVDGEAIINELVAFQAASPAWDGLPPDDGDEA